MYISPTTRIMCGLTLITIPTIEYGGVFCFCHLRKCSVSQFPGYTDLSRLFILAAGLIILGVSLLKPHKSS